MRPYFLLIFWLLAAPLMAQTTITGTVSDAKTNELLPFATVYVAGTTQGTLTDSTGRFTLSKLSAGAVPLVVSMVGYQPYQQTITITASLTATSPAPIIIRLTAMTNMLDEATVKARRDKTWERQVARFSAAFFGDSPNQAQCTIQNKWVLDFSETGGTLSAKAQQPLLIENRASGYLIRYDLREFALSATQFRLNGTAYFSALKPQRDNEPNRWNRNRQQIYGRSLRAFLRAFVANSLMASGFTAYPVPSDVVYKYGIWDKSKPYIKSSDLIVDTQPYIKPGTLPGTYKLQLPPLLEVSDIQRYVTLASQQVFNQNPNSWLRPLKATLEVGADGWLTDPAALETIGFWAEERVAEMLPREYVPGETLRNNALPEEVTDKPASAAPVVYLATNKETYRAGERIWFSAFVCNQASRHLMLGSQPLYVQLYDGAGQTLLDEVVFTGNGRGTGGLLLPDSLSGGLYRLRAFTRQMLNTPTLMFQKTLSVNNLRESSQYRLLPTLTKSGVLTDTLTMTITTDKPSYQRREKITVSLRSLAMGQPIRATCTIAVTDAAQVEPPQSNLKQFWQQPPSGELKKGETNPETGLRYMGSVRSADGAKAMPKATITLFDPSRPANPRIIQADNAGRFVLDSVDFDENATLPYQITDRKGRAQANAELLMEPLLPYQTLAPMQIDPACVIAALPSQKPTQETLPDGEKAASLLDTKQLDEVKVKADAPVNEQPGVIRVHNDESFGTNFDENGPQFPNVIEMMSGRLPGVSVTPTASGQGYNVLIRGIATTNDFDPLFILDGVPVDFKSDRSLSFVNPQNVRRIEVLSGSNAAIYGSRGGNGVIAIYTGHKRAEAATQKKIELKGYQAVPAFVSPDYSEPLAIDRPDQRQTLYWNPSVSTATDGTATVSFFAADRPTTYRIVVEGMNSTGLIGQKTIMVVVK
jgi:hypothetical protein